MAGKLTPIRPNNEAAEVSERLIGEPEMSVASRKRALLAGLAAAPAVVTLLSRSAFAQTPNQSVRASIAPGTSLHPGIATQQPVAGRATTQSTQQLGDTQSTQQLGDIRRPVR
jgi:hypothetical protein